MRLASDSNPGWHPALPAFPKPMEFSYKPDPWEPMTMSGAATDPVIGPFRWTRGTETQNGLAVRDFGGPETCSGQPGCP